MVWIKRDWRGEVHDKSNLLSADGSFTSGPHIWSSSERQDLLNCVSFKPGAGHIEIKVFASADVFYR
jgi:hypothetical protein